MPADLFENGKMTNKNVKWHKLICNFLSLLPNECLASFKYGPGLQKHSQKMQHHFGVGAANLVN